MAQCLVNSYRLPTQIYESTLIPFPLKAQKNFHSGKYVSFSHFGPFSCIISIFDFFLVAKNIFDLRINYVLINLDYLFRIGQFLKMCFVILDKYVKFTDILNEILTFGYFSTEVDNYVNGILIIY